MQRYSRVDARWYSANLNVARQVESIITDTIREACPNVGCNQPINEFRVLEIRWTNLDAPGSATIRVNPLYYISFGIKILNYFRICRFHYF